jgi:hypothetical protein
MQGVKSVKEKRKGAGNHEMEERLMGFGWLARVADA